MEILIYQHRDAASEAAAILVAAQVIQKPSSVLAFASGATPQNVYAHLVAMTEKGLLDWEDIWCVNPMEYIGIAKDDKRSITRHMAKSLYAKINLRRGNVRVLNGCAADLDQECMDVEDSILKKGGLDLLLVGIGAGGQLIGNEPGAEFASITQTASVDEQILREAGNPDFPINELPNRVMTMGTGTIMAAKKIICLAFGQEKAEIVNRIINGTITPQVPASVLQLHNDVTYIFDDAAAMKL